MSETIGFIGLGRMGLPMARSLMEAGCRLRVYNRTPEKAAPLVARGAARVERPGDVAEPGGVVFTMVSDDRVLEAVTLGEEGLRDRLGEGGIHVSQSTIGPETARRLAKYHEEHGARYVAAPVFGKPEVAEAKKLWVCLSGDAGARERILPMVRAMGQAVYDFGEDPGAANVVKLAGNFVIAAAVEAMAEAFTLAQKNGIPREQVHELFSQTFLACPVYRNYGKLIAAEHYEPIGAVPSMIQKDMALVLDLAQASLTPMPFAGIVFDRMTATVAKGRDDIDWAGFAQEVSESAGL
jgi:3-hydroxyisobutyrate dehydrogenase-like beta-hydroxyacid dehydrogenase